MVLLSSFLGGALGHGLEQTALNIDRREARQAEIDLADRRLRETLGSRERLQDERLDAAMDRVQARIDAAVGKGGGSGGSSGTRRALIERDQAEIAGDAAHDLAARTGMSLPEASGAISAYQSGENHYRRTGAAPGEVLDPRDAQAAAGRSEPDEAKFREVMKSVATAFKRSTVRPKDAKDAAEASGLYQSQDLTSGVLAGQVDAGQAGRAVAAGKGDGAFKVDGNTRLDQFSGDMTPTAVGSAAIRKDDAAAREHDAKAGKTGVEKKALVDNGGMTPTERVGLLNSYRASVDDAQREMTTATQRLERAQGRKATLPDDKKAKQAEIDAAQQALDAATSKKRTAEQNLSALQNERRGKGEGKNDGKPADRAKDADRAQALSLIGKPKKGGGTITRADVASRFKDKYGEEL